jgi:hypothetical protein
VSSIVLETLGADSDVSTDHLDTELAKSFASFLLWV